MLGFNAISEKAIAQLPSIFIYASGVNTTGVAGDETVTADAEVSGFSASGAVGTLGEESIQGKANISITGLSATLSPGNVLLWGLMVPSIANSYSSISTGASQSWTDISTGASQTWTDIAS